MEMSVVNEQGKRLSYKKEEQAYTRFKLSNKHEAIMIAAILLNGVAPIKRSSLFTYFVAKGDFLNGEKHIRKYSDVINVLTGQLES